jgi:hypothetical protein
MKMEQTECSETLAFKLQTPGNNPEENTRHLFKARRKFEIRKSVSVVRNMHISSLQSQGLLLLYSFSLNITYSPDKLHKYNLLNVVFVICLTSSSVTWNILPEC